MATRTQSRNRATEIELTTSRLFAQVFQAYMESDATLQQVVQDMVRIVNDPEVDDDDRAMAVATLHEALFPIYSPYDGQLGESIEDEERYAIGEEKAAHDEIDREHTTFASRVVEIMKTKGMTQTQLAQAIGVQQSAVSLLLSRDSRPQRRTVLKIADALGVPSGDLWPSHARA
jgi:DNA-binding XRE family transcriptional regulator